MHEMSIATEILKQALAAAARHNAIHISEVDVVVGRMRGIVPEALQMAFQAAAEGTIAEGATLKMTEQSVLAVCRECECTYAPQPDEFVCPVCKAANARIVAGNDIILQFVTCEEPESQKSGVT